MTAAWPPRNLLCYGDNLAFLKQFDDECVDLVYLDPPFNSQQNYNVLFKESGGTPEAAQIKAFEDTWTWDMAANVALQEINTDPAVPAPLVELMRTFMDFLRPSPMMAYLVQMAIRLVHLRRVLKPTGSLYLHCDPTASHYLKIVLDGIFGATNFLNEITWKRSSAHSDTKQGMRRCGRIRDILLVYTKSQDYTWNPQYTAYSDDYLQTEYRHVMADGRHYKETDCTAAKPGGDTEYEWRVKRPARKGVGWEADLANEYLKPKAGVEYKGVLPYRGRYWAYSKENMAAFARAGNLIHRSTGMPRIVHFADEMPGVSIQDLWDDIPPVSGNQDMGYPTQKPIALLHRVISASSNPGDVVLDPFCGCGTTIDAVETLNREHPDQPPRKWIGIDVTHLSINLIKHRLTRFSPPPEYDVQGEPASVAGAAALAGQDPYQFQFWALGLVGARPSGGKPKKGADRGIDGVRFFQDEQRRGVWVAKKMLVQVKSGHVKAGDVRDLVGTMSREQSELAVFVTLEEPTQPMRTEAASAGLYTSPYDNQSYPRVQILTVEQLLADPHRPNPSCLQIPGGPGGPNVTLPEAPKHRRKGTHQHAMDFDSPSDDSDDD
ncbi:MAG: restriction endonuclease [Planctomycetes bacterium]|nr:restriction endonuclease [Planctomycetota bacterium]